MGMHTLHAAEPPPPLVPVPHRQITKTTIRQGVICRDKVWVDAGERELVRHPHHWTFKDPPPPPKRLTHTPQWEVAFALPARPSDEELLGLVAVLCGGLALWLCAFVLGWWCGRQRLCRRCRNELKGPSEATHPTHPVTKRAVTQLAWTTHRPHTAIR